MGALQEVVTQMTPPPQADSGSPGQPVTPVPSTAGDFGPRLSEEGQLYATQHRRGAGGHTCCVCFKVPATCCLWSGAAPLSLRAPRARSPSPGPLGPPRKAGWMSQSPPAAVSPSCAQRMTEMNDPTTFSKEQGHLQGNLGP